MSNITSVVFDKCNETKVIYGGLWQYDYGQILRIEGLNLPPAVEIHFSLQETGGEAKRRIGITKSGVTDVVIPDFILEGNDATRNYDAYAFIYLSDEESGETTHKIKMQIKSRSKPEGSTGSNETGFGAIMDALKTFAAGKADGLKYENSILKLMSGEAELARVTIKAGEGTGSDAREIELQKSDTAIQWRYVGDEEWTDLVLLEELKGEKGDPGEGGKTAYQYAQDGGYTGTEEEFAKKLAQENPTREEFSQLSEEIDDLKENGGGGNSVVETTKTVSVGTEAVTLESGIDEQEVNLVWNVQGAGSVPAFENYYIEKSNISYPRTFNANGYTQFWGDANYHGNSEKHVSGHEYLQVFHYTMDGDSVAVLNKTGGSPKYITPTNSENLTGSGWVYMLAKPANCGAIVLNLSNTGTGAGTIDYLYCIDITALQENGTITATTINELAELFGELPLVPGQNFEGKTTDGTANLTITREGVDTVIPSSETSATVKGGDVLKTDNGTVVFSVIAQVIASASAIWADKKWVAFGDSLTDEAINADKKYYRHIEEKTGINVVVMGKGGTGYYITQDSGTCFYQRMANVPSDADVITILGSINDWKYYQHDIQVGTATDTLESGTLCGYMNKCIDVAIEKAPYAQIALISAPYYHGLGTDRQEELCTALQGVAKHRRVKFLDLYHESGFRIDNPTFAKQYTTDYSETAETFGHPNNAFHEKYLAPDFMELLKRMLLY